MVMATGVKLMIDTPTRRAVIGAGVFVAGSILAIDCSVAETPLAATPACPWPIWNCFLSTAGIQSRTIHAASEDDARQTHHEHYADQPIVAVHQ